MTENEIGTLIVDTSIQVHRSLGPGLLESVYELVLAHCLESAGLQVERQVRIPIVYKSMTFDEGFRADLLIEHKVLIEIKSVENLIPAHKKQLLTYLKLSGHKLGYLLNFGEELMHKGIVRIINGTLDS